VKGIFHNQYYPEYPGKKFWGPFLEESEDMFEDFTLNLPLLLMGLASIPVIIAMTLGLLIICYIRRRRPNVVKSEIKEKEETKKTKSD